VKQREHRCARDREQRHRFREAVDRCPPLLPEEEQDGGNQRSGVADTDPPDEVDDVEGPADGNVVAPNPDTGEQQLDDRHVEDHQEQERDCESQEPPNRCPVREDDPADLVRNRTEGMTRRDDVGGARQELAVRGRHAAGLGWRLQRLLGM
jgi:hypothetical protein